MITTIIALLILGVGPPQARFDDVVRNLRNPDPNARMNALRMLGESKYVEAILPIAPLVNDPVDAIQLEAIGTELSLYLVEEVRSRKRVALIVETRTGTYAESAFHAGPLATWPRPVPPELTTALLRAIDDENPKVRFEAIYALGTIAQPPLSDDAAQGLVKALDHYDPAIRAAAARVIGRLQVGSAAAALMTAVNDSQQPVRFAAMRALGEIRHQSAVDPLVAQLEHYRKGEGAWSALDALAKIADPATVPLFKTRLGDRDHFIRRAAMEGLGRVGDTSELTTLVTTADRDTSGAVRAAAAFAVYKLGRDYAARLVALLGDDKLVAQVADYLIELGPAVNPALEEGLQDSREAVRGNSALILGLVGTKEHLPALQALAQDRSKDVRTAAERSIERIKLRGA